MPSSNPHTPKPPSTPVVVEGGVVPKKKGGGVEQNELIAYAWKVSNKNKGFILTIEAESGWVNTRSHQIGANGYYDYTECQLNKKYHAPFLNSQAVKYPKKRIDECWRVYEIYEKKGILDLRFFGHRRINDPKVKNNIIF